AHRLDAITLRGLLRRRRRRLRQAGRLRRAGLWRLLRARARFDVAENVVLRYAPRRARAFELRDVYAVLARDVAHKRTGLRAAQLFDRLRAAIAARLR